MNIRQNKPQSISMPFLITTVFLQFEMLCYFSIHDSKFSCYIVPRTFITFMLTCMIICAKLYYSNLTKKTGTKTKKLKFQ